MNNRYIAIKTKAIIALVSIFAVVISAGFTNVNLSYASDTENGDVSQNENTNVGDVQTEEQLDGQNLGEVQTPNQKIAVPDELEPSVGVLGDDGAGDGTSAGSSEEGVQPAQEGASDSELNQRQEPQEQSAPIRPLGTGTNTRVFSGAWWLRTPTNYRCDASSCAVSAVNSGGTVYASGGLDVSYPYAVRPALFVKLSSIATYKAKLQVGTCNNNSDTDSKNCIVFGGYAFDVIGINNAGSKSGVCSAVSNGGYTDSGGAECPNNTVALLLSNASTKLGTSVFRSPKSANAWNYFESGLNNAMNNAYTNTVSTLKLNGATTTPTLADMIVPRSLANGAVNPGNSGGNVIAGAPVTDAHFFPLSATEASALYAGTETPPEVSIRQATTGASADITVYSDFWWLRTPGDCGAGYCIASIVDSGGSVYAIGDNVTYSYAVRPALFIPITSLSSIKSTLQVGTCPSDSATWEASPNCVAIAGANDKTRAFDIVGINKGGTQKSGTCALDTSIFGDGYTDGECPNNSVMLLLSNNQTASENKFENAQFFGSFTTTANSYSGSILKTKMEAAYTTVLGNNVATISGTTTKLSDVIIPRNLAGDSPNIAGGICFDGSDAKDNGYNCNTPHDGYKNDIAGINCGNPTNAVAGSAVTGANFFPLSSAEAYYLRYLMDYTDVTTASTPEQPNAPGRPLVAMPRTVSFDLPEGTTPSSIASITVDSGGTFEMPAGPTVHDATFMGWCEESDVVSDMYGAYCRSSKIIDAGSDSSAITADTTYRAMFSEDAPQISTDFWSDNLYKITNEYSGAKYYSDRHQSCTSANDQFEVFVDSLPDGSTPNKNFYDDYLGEDVILTCGRSGYFDHSHEDPVINFDAYLYRKNVMIDGQEYRFILSCPSGTFDCVNESIVGCIGPCLINSNNSNIVANDGFKVDPIATDDESFTGLDTEITDSNQLAKLFEIHLEDDQGTVIPLISTANVYIQKALNGKADDKIAKVYDKHGAEDVKELEIKETRGENIHFQTDSFSLFGIAYAEAPQGGSGDSDASQAGGEQVIADTANPAQTGANAMQMVLAMLLLLGFGVVLRTRFAYGVHISIHLET